MALCIAYTKEDIYDFLRKNHYNESRNISSDYVLLEYPDGDGGTITEATYFMPFQDVYFESPCMIGYTKIHDDGNGLDAWIDSFVRDVYEVNPNDDDSVQDTGCRGYRELFDYTKSMIRGDCLYEIENFQTAPYLEFPCTIHRIMSEQETLQYILDRDNSRKVE